MNGGDPIHRAIQRIIIYGCLTQIPLRHFAQQPDTAAQMLLYQLRFWLLLIISMRIRLQRILHNFRISQRIFYSECLLGITSFRVADAIIYEILPLRRTLRLDWIPQLIQIDKPPHAPRVIVSLLLLGRCVPERQLALPMDKIWRLQAHVCLASAYILVALCYHGLLRSGAGPFNVNPGIRPWYLLLMPQLLADVPQFRLHFQVEWQHFLLLLFILILIQPIMYPSQVANLLRLVIPKSPTAQIIRLLIALFILPCLLARKKMESFWFRIHGVLCVLQLPKINLLRAWRFDLLLPLFPLRTILPFLKTLEYLFQLMHFRVFESVYAQFVVACRILLQLSVGALLLFVCLKLRGRGQRLILQIILAFLISFILSL